MVTLIGYIKQEESPYEITEVERMTLENEEVAKSKGRVKCICHKWTSFQIKYC